MTKDADKQGTGGSRREREGPLAGERLAAARREKQITIPEVAKELEALQSSNPADTPDQVRSTVRSELGAPPEELFASFG